MGVIVFNKRAILRNNLSCNEHEIFKEGVYEVSKYQKRTVYISIVTLAFFLILSLITQQWGFLLWSLLPIFMVLMTTFFTKFDRKSSGKWKGLFNHRVRFLYKRSAPYSVIGPFHVVMNEWNGTLKEGASKCKSVLLNIL